MPFDFIEDTAATQAVTVDREAFEGAMEGQRDKGRKESMFGDGKKGDEFSITGGMLADELRLAGDKFDGYSSTRAAGVPVLALFDDQRRPTVSLTKGQAGYLALARTPFYLEAGGQVSDSGRIFSEASDASATVDALVRIRQGLR